MGVVCDGPKQLIGANTTSQRTSNKTYHIPAETARKTLPYVGGVKK